MRSLAAMTRKQLPVIMIMAVLLIFVSGYYLIYIPKKSAALEKQHFKWLQNIDQGIREKIAGCDTLLDNFAQTYQATISNPVVQKYLSNYTIFNTSVRYSHSQQKDSAKGAARKSAGDYQSSKKFILDTDSKLDELIIGLTWDSQGEAHKLFITVGLEDFMKPMLTSDVFDHYIIFYNGNRIFEDFHSGISYRSEDSILANPGKFKGPVILEQNVGGEDYRIFLQPVDLYGKSILIAGLHAAQKFNTEKKALPAGVMIFFVSASLAVLLLIPWLKIYFMGKYDKLMLRDLIWSVIVVKLLTSVLFYLFLQNGTGPGDEFSSTGDLLADSITTRMKREVDVARVAIESLNKIYEDSRGTKPFDLVNIGSGNLIRTDMSSAGGVRIPVTDDGFTNRIKRAIGSLSIKEINWLDSGGRVISSWNTKKFTNVPAGYAYRDYFKNVHENRLCYDESGKAAGYSLDQVISRTSGSFSTVLSVAGLKNTVVSLSFNMLSLSSPVLPAGYQFAIIDEEGRTRYHSRQERNLNEKLLDEFSASDQASIFNALKGRHRIQSTTEYYERTYKFLVRPIANLPYYVVILKNMQYPEIAETSIFFFNTGMSLLFFVIVIVDIIILVYSSARKSQVERQYFVTTWLWPRQTSEQEYGLAALGNLIIFIVLVIVLMADWMIFSQYLICLIVSITLMSCFLNAVFLVRYKRLRDFVYIRYKTRAAWWSGIFLLVLNLIALINIHWSGYWPVAVYQMVVVMILGMLLIHRYRRFGKQTWGPAYAIEGDQDRELMHQPHKHYLNKFALMIVLRIIITSGLPVFFFYSNSFDFEQGVMTRYRQYDFARQLAEWLHRSNDSIGKTVNLWQMSTAGAVYIDKHSIDTFYLSNSPAISFSVSGDSSGLSPLLLTSFGSYSDGQIALGTNSFYKSSAFDSSLRYNDLIKDVLRSKQPNVLQFRTILRQKAEDQFIVIKEATGNGFNFFSADSNIYGKLGTILSLILLFILLFLFIHSISRKIFAGNRLFKLAPNRISFNSLHKVAGPKKIFITCAEPEEAVNSIAEAFGDNIVCIDFAEKENYSGYALKKVSASVKAVLIYHMEQDIHLPELNLFKITAIRKLSSTQKVCILVSGITERQLLKFLTESARKTSTGKKIINCTPPISDLFSEYEISFHPLEININRINCDRDQQLPDSKKGRRDWILRKRVEEETMYSVFLSRVRSTLVSAADDNSTGKLSVVYDSEDAIILQIQSFSRAFYRSLWDSCASDEQFLLYELAQDGLLNPSDNVTLHDLVEKGLIRSNNGGFQLFNRSFRNFIISGLTSVEYKFLQKQYEDGNSWDKIRRPVVFAVIAVLVFLSLSQQGLYSKVTGLISAITTAIPLIIGLLGLQTSAKKDY